MKATLLAKSSHGDLDKKEKQIKAAFGKGLSFGF
jgi:hypothetical protein